MPSIFSAPAGVRRAAAAALAAVLLGWLSVAAHAQGCPTPSFISSKKFAAGTIPVSVASGDFNLDGRADLAVANNSSHNVSVLLGDGAGNFSAPTNFVVGSSPESVAVGEFNGDARPDLAVVNRESANVSVLLGDGAGGFGPPANLAVGSSPRSVVVRDFNRDGRQDLAVANFFTASVSVLLGDGAGNFSAASNFAVGGTGASFITSADFNGDDKADLAVSNFSTGNATVLLGDGAGGFGAPANFFAGGSPTSVTVADFNGDANADLALADDTLGRLVVLFGDGAGKFGNALQRQVGERVRDLKAGDFNGDGKADIAITSFTNNRVVVLLGDGAGGFGPPASFSTGTYPWSIVVSDFNGDARPDLAVANSQSANVTVLLGSALGLFSATRFFAAGADAHALLTADFNLDGRPDLLSVNRSGFSLSVLLGDGAGGVSGAIHLPRADSPAHAGIGDFNRDGRPDLAVISGPANNVAILTGSGTGQFTQTGTFPVGFGPEAVEVADLNSDGLPDLAVANRNTNTLSLLLGNGDGTFASATSVFVGSNPSFVTSGDLNGDGQPDLVATLVEGTSAVAVLLATGPATFGPPVNFPVGSSPLAATVSDFDGDGRADLAVANTGSHNVSVLKGNGAGGFSAPTNYAVGFNPSSAVVADLNGDGQLDIATENFNNVNGDSVSILQGDGAGNFAPAVNFDAGLFPSSLVTADLNQDGRPDLAATNNNAGTVAVLINSCEAPFAPFPQLSVGDVTLTEGHSGTAQAVFTVSLSAASSRTVTAAVYTNDATAARGADYQPALGSLTFAPGVTAQTFAVSINGDVLDEFDETFGVTLRYPLGATLGAARAIGTIADDDPEPTISIADATATEGAAGSTLVNLTLTLSAASGKPITAQVSTSDGTAVAGPDYTALNTTVTFNPGTTAQTVSLSVKGDTLDEPDETLSVNLANVANAAVADGQAVVTILDDDPPPAVSVSDVTANEGRSGATSFVFLVTLSSPSAKVVSVSFATADGTAAAGSDYAALSGTVVFNPSETVKQIVVAVNGDLATEPDQTFLVNLTDPVNATIADGQGLGTILNYVPPTLAFGAASFSVAEAAGHFTVSVTRTGDTALPVSVEYATADVTASERSDYTTALGTLRFAAGETAKSFDVLVTDDGKDDDDESLVLSLSNPAGGAVLGSPGQATLSITDDEAAPAATNPIDGAAFFVGQHYHDFLNRQADASGLLFWQNEITSCGADAGCIDFKRASVSQAFFLSTEFQRTGYQVFRVYRATFTDSAPRPRGLPRFHEFLRDTQELQRGVVVGQGAWEAQLAANLSEFVGGWVQRAEFVAQFPAGMTAEAFVDKLFANSQVAPAPAERDAAIAAYGAGATEGRAAALLSVTGSGSVYNRQYNPAFVLMQYFGYLRRNPDDSPEPNLDFGGYDFWLTKLNQFSVAGEDVRDESVARGRALRAEMVRSFLVSGEYRGRFGL